MHDQLSFEEALRLFLEEPNRLDAVLRGLSEAEMAQKQVSAGQTIRQVVHHLADGDQMWAMYMKVAISASGSSFAADWYPGDDTWAERMSFQAREAAPAIALFRANRAYVAQALRAMPDTWERTLTFKHSDDDESYRYSVADIVGLLVRHARQHVQEIEELSLSEDGQS